MAVTAPAVPSACELAWKWIPRVLVLVALIVPRLLSYSAAGGLWRDEAHSVNMAILPADDVFFVLTNDSFPMFWPVILRAWISAFGSGDGSVRLLGLLIGLAVIPAMWWMARQFDVAFPWWLMVLLGLDPSLIVFGGEVRGYGLGVVTFLILIGVSWRALQEPSPWRWTLLTIAALLAVQSSFTNCFLLAATFIACGIAALHRGRYRACAGFGLIGTVAAASMAPYALYVFPRLSGIVKPFVDPVTWRAPVHVFREAYRWGGEARTVLWPTLGLLVLVEVVYRLIFCMGKRRSEGTLEPLNDESNFAVESQQRESVAKDQDLTLFLLPFLLLGTTGFCSYMYILGVHTAKWYHLPCLTVLAVSADLGMHLWVHRRPRRHWQIVGLATLACMIVLCEATPHVRYRFTTLDLIARDLNAAARAGDLVVVEPWYLGIPFGRYYHGPAEWIKIPNIDGRHRPFEELKDRLTLPTPVSIQEELRKIETVLQSGGRIWWVGFGKLKLLPPGVLPVTLAGAADGKCGRQGNAYIASWEQLAIARMQSVGVTVSEWRPPLPTGVGPDENPSVYVLEPSRFMASRETGGQPDHTLR